MPFFYFFGLSLATIIASTYWLFKIPGGVAASYAQTNLQNVEITVSKNEGTFVEFVDTSNCNDPIANKIDAYFESVKAPLAGEGCSFIYHAYQNDMEPLLVPAIAMCESTGGKVTPQFQGKESYNAWGWAVYDNNDTTKQVDGYGCDSWEHCIGRVTRGIARKRDRGLAPEDIVQWYTPASVRKANGDPTLAPWVLCVRSTMGKIDAIKP